MSLALRDTWSGLVNSPLRTCICILCVSLGVASVNLVFAMNHGYLLALTSKLGVTTGEIVTVALSAKNEPGNSARFADVHQAVLATPGALWPSVESGMSPAYQLARYQKRTFTGAIVATDVRYATHNKVAVRRGRFLSEADSARKAQVAVLGAKTASQLFQADDPVGKTIFLGSEQFKVIGVLETVAAVGYLGNRELIIPFPTAMQLDPKGAEASAKVVFQVREKSAAAIDATMNAVKARLQRAVGKPTKLRVGTAEATLLWARQQASSQSTVLSLVAFIIVIVAGIAIMNVYYVSVAQRTSEIGIRIAVGASRYQIGAMVLRDVAMTAVLGAFAGCALAYLAGALIPALTAMFASPVFIWQHGVMTGVGAIFIALLFTLFPAWNAARMDPIAAINSVGV